MQQNPQAKSLSLAYIIGTYPGLTTTFIDREVRALRASGAKLQIISIRRPWTQLSPEQALLQEGVIYLLPVNPFEFALSHLWYAVTQAKTYFGTLAYLLTRKHPNLAARLKTFFHFCEGVYAAWKMRKLEANHIHAHFIDRAATVALVVSRFNRTPYSLTAHASDIYVNPVMLPEKLGSARFVVTCTRYNKEYLSQFGKGLFNHKLDSIYHGLDVERYSRKNGRKPGSNLIVSVGQLKERKGFKFLVEACRLLADHNCNFECRIIGEGPLRSKLEEQISNLNLEDRVHLLGALTHDEVIDQYSQAAVFALPAILGENGDRDGIPNVILEAMAMELPVVSTNHSGIPEVVIDSLNGLLVPPADPASLAVAIETLLNDPEWGARMGREGRQLVEENFDPEKNASILLNRFLEASSPHKAALT